MHVCNVAYRQVLKISVWQSHKYTASMQYPSISLPIPFQLIKESKMAKPGCLQVFPKYNPSFLGDQKRVLSMKKFFAWCFLKPICSCFI